MKSFPKLMIATVVAAACAHSAQAVNMVQIDGAHASFFYDADFWGLGTASVVGDKISFSTPSYFNQHAEGYGKSGEDTDRYTNQTGSAVVAVAKNGYHLTGGIDYDVTTTYAQPVAGAFASQVNNTNISTGTWNGKTFVSGTQLGQFSLFLSRSSGADGIGSGSTANTGTISGAGTYSVVGLDSYLFLSTSQRGVGYSEAGLSTASYQFGVSAVPEPATYGMLLGGVAVLALAGRRRRKLLGGSLLAAASLAGTAQAANYVEVVGTHVSFFYDADYWGDNAATVVGDKITLSTPTYVDRTAVGHSPSEKNQRTFVDNASAALVAVARSGYALTGVVGYKPTITYSVSASGSQIELAGGESLYYGAFNGANFASSSAVGYFSYSTKVDSNGVAHSGVTNDPVQNGFLYNGPSLFDTLAVDNSLYLTSIQTGVGTTKSAVAYSYDFGIATAVPEPATYGMLLGGLGALALAARRKRGEV
ncbi:hypothetical protein FHW83_003440 [Duganella sp. SG902]|uniref:PEP-CTERM sorting domain-containing protein n=1 Tax=Duganella sp. SG902 TaxID=2587016 RepID=UPI0018077A6F|nr:PEP-CTERM sorting domain-containing protein [Duganella sp. SG902]NVM77622.1 hypothetical protein [Duganella sp. SG902]